MDIIAVDKFWQLINEKLEGWLEAGIKILPNIMVAILLAIFFGVLAKYVGRAAQKLLHRTLESEQIANLLASVIKVLVLFAGLFVALDFLGLSPSNR